MNWNEAPSLSVGGIRLEQLEARHAAALADAVRDGNLHEAWYATTPAPADMEDNIAMRRGRQAAGTMAPWAIIDDATGTALGATTFLNIDPENRRLEIGSTFLAASAQGRGANPAARLLLLERAFETLDVLAVEFRTHRHNQQSRAAIARLGAKQDGVLRNHMYDPRTNMLRDTVVFSILPGEWPTVKVGLQARLAKYGRI